MIKNPTRSLLADLSCARRFAAPDTQALDASEGRFRRFATGGIAIKVAADRTPSPPATRATTKLETANFVLSAGLSRQKFLFLKTAIISLIGREKSVGVPA